MATSLIAQDALDKDFQLVWPFRRKLIENSFAAAFMRIAACNFVGNLRSEKQGSQPGISTGTATATATRPGRPSVNAGSRTAMSATTPTATTPTPPSNRGRRRSVTASTTTVTGRRTKGCRPRSGIRMGTATATATPPAQPSTSATSQPATLPTTPTATTLMHSSTRARPGTRTLTATGFRTGQRSWSVPVRPIITLPRS